MKLLILLYFCMVLVIIHTKQIKSICQACHTIVNIVQKGMPQKPFVNTLEQIGTQYCTLKHIQNHQICKGAVKAMGLFIVNSIWKHLSDPHSICPKLKLCSKQYQKRNLQNDIDKILVGKPDKQWQQPTKRSILRVLHISDLHPDSSYMVGAPTKCKQPLCCRANVTSIDDQANDNNTAGYWGSLADCDLPMQTLQLFLQQIKNLNIDLILWTGDNTPHDIWAQTQSYNLNYTAIISQKLKQYTNATIIPVMGNHQSWPVNVYDYQGSRQQVLNGGLAQAWKSWLDASAYKMLRTKGYYSIILPKLNNIKIICINTQAGNDQNWFLLKNPTDPGSMLQWIQNELKQSQLNEQKVWIIGHIPPKSNLNQWSIRYNALIQRYSYIIRGQFFGHTHQDHVGFYYSLKKKQGIISYYLVSPSLTTFNNKNPQYRIMQVDFDTVQVTDYTQYTLNLSKYQNKDDNAHFQVLYSFKQTYNVQDLTVRGGMTNFADKIQNDNETQIIYTKLMDGGISQGHSGKSVYCGTMTYPAAQFNCMHPTKKYKKNSMQKYAGPWKDLITSEQ